MSSPIKREALVQWLPELLKHLGADAARIEALTKMLGDNGQIRLDLALQASFPDKDGQSAVNAFRNLRARVREVNAAIVMEVDERKIAANLRHAWFAPNPSADINKTSETIQAFTKGQIGIKTASWIPSTGYSRDDMGKFKFSICFWRTSGISKQAKNRIEQVIKALQSELCHNLHFAFDFSDIQDLPVGESKERSRWMQLQRANLAIAFITFDCLNTENDAMRHELFGGSEKAGPVVMAVPVDGVNEKNHDLREFANITRTTLNGLPLSKISNPQVEEFVGVLRDSIATFLREHQVPLAIRWESEVAAIALLAASVQSAATQKDFEPTHGTPTTLLVMSRDISSARLSLFDRVISTDYLDGWLYRPQAQPYFALLGEFGMGKTTTLKNWCRQRLYQWQIDPMANPLPIFIDLSQLNDVLQQERAVLSRDGLGMPDRQKAAETRLYALSAEEILDAVLLALHKTNTDSPRLYAAELIRRVRNDGALLVLDSLDEVLVHLSDVAASNLIEKLLRLLPPNAWLDDSTEPINGAYPINRLRADGTRPGYLLLACRDNFFRSQDDATNRLLKGQRAEWSSAHIDAFTLLPFNEEQIRNYLGKLFPDRNVDELLSMLAEIHNLPDMMERPYHLKLICDQLRDPLSSLEQARQTGNQVNAASLYHGIVRAGLSRDDTKHWLRQEHKIELLGEVALQLHRNGRTSWEIAEMEDWFATILKEHPKWQDGIAGGAWNTLRDQLNEDLRTASFLVQAGVGSDTRFRFAHRSLAEYFLARAWVMALRDPERTIEAWSVSLPSDETLAFVEQIISSEFGHRRSELDAGWSRIKQSGNVLAATNLLALVLARHARLRTLGERLWHFDLPSLDGTNFAGLDLIALTQRYTLCGQANAPLVLTRCIWRNVRAVGLVWRFVDVSCGDFEDADLRSSRFIDSVGYEQCGRRPFALKEDHRDQ